MSGLCHSSELTLRSPQLIPLDSLDREGISGACWAGSFLIWHMAHCGEPAKKGAEGTPGIQGSNARGTGWTLLWYQLTPDVIKPYSLAGDHPPAVPRLPACASSLMLDGTASPLHFLIFLPLSPSLCLPLLLTLSIPSFLFLLLPALF